MLTNSNQVEESGNWKIRTQELAYVLHVMYRFAYLMGGEIIRDKLQDDFTPNSARRLVDVSWSPPQNKIASEHESFVRRMTAETINNINDYEMVFSEYDQFLIGPDKYILSPILSDGREDVLLLPPENDVIHGLSTTISEDIGINPTPQLRQLVAQSNTSAFAENDLLSYINQTISEYKK